MRFPARPAQTPPTLPEWDPAWSRIVEAVTEDGPHSFHVLDTLEVLRAEGLEPTGTILALHGNPTWSYLWRHLAQASVNAARTGGRVWRLIAPDQLDMGFSQRLSHESLPTSQGAEVRRMSQRIDDFDSVVSPLLAEVVGSAAHRDAAASADHPIVTIGHDWGGVLSLGWAARNTDLVSASISLNTAVHQPEDAPIPAPLRATLAGPMLPTATVVTDWFLRVTMSLGGLDPEIKDAFRAPYDSVSLRHGIGGFVADIPVDVSHPSHSELQRVGADIAAIDHPALLVWGPKDPVFLERYLRDLRQRLPQADVHRFELGSHLVSEDYDVAGVVTDWLTTQFPGDGAGASGASGASAESAPVKSASAAATTVDSTDADVQTRDAAPARGVTAILDARHDDETIASVDFAQNPAQQITWRHLWHVTTSIAGGLLELGVRPGDRVCMLVPPGNNLTAALYACLKIGAVAVVADAGLGPKGMTRATTSADPQWIIGELSRTRPRPRLQLARPPHLRVPAGTDAGQAVPGRDQPDSALAHHAPHRSADPGSHRRCGDPLHLRVDGTGQGCALHPRRHLGPRGSADPSLRRPRRHRSGCRLPALRPAGAGHRGHLGDSGHVRDEAEDADGRGHLRCDHRRSFHDGLRLPG